MPSVEKPRSKYDGRALGIRDARVDMPTEVPELRPGSADRRSIPGRRPDLVIDVGRAPPMPASIRRPLDAVVIVP